MMSKKGSTKERVAAALVSLLGLLLLVSTGCKSIENFAMKKVANTLTAPGGSTVFTGDNDPDLVGAALPFAIKLYESLLVSIPSHPGLNRVTGSLYVMYAHAFLYTPATMLTNEEYKQQEHLFKRAKNLYLRGRDILLEFLEKRHKGFKAALEKKDYERALQGMKKEDVDFLYWAGAGWLGAYAIDPFDMDLAISMPRAAALMEKVRELDEAFMDGAIHDFYVTYYGSLPDYMGGDLEKARHHFDKAVQFSKGKLTSPYLSLATTVCVEEQNAEEFKSLLKKVLAIDADAYPEYRLINVLNQRKARWLLEHVEDFFLPKEPMEAEEEENQEELP